MWSRSELKQTAKIRFKANYWKSILAALILILVIGGGSGTGFGTKWLTNHGGVEREQQNQVSVTEWGDGESKAHTYYNVDHVVSGINNVFVIAAVILLIIVVFLFICIIVIPLQILVLNPLEIGCKRFFAKNLKGDAQVREICYAFDNGYKNNIKTMFFRNLYIFLWILLLIIPGIIKSYEYQMIPYILAENPNITTKEAFALSKKMMYGNKWKSFVLDLVI